MTGKMRNIRSVLFLTALSCLMSFSLAVAEQASPDKEVEAMVLSAAKLIQKKGVAAFDELNAGGDAWVKGDTGIFVSDESGKELVNPVQPELVGQSLWKYKDADGKLIIQEQWKLVKEKGQGWYAGTWQKPGTEKQTNCRSFVKGVTVDGKEYLVGAAYYLD